MYPPRSSAFIYFLLGFERSELLPSSQRYEKRHYLTAASLIFISLRPYAGHLPFAFFFTSRTGDHMHLEALQDIEILFGLAILIWLFGPVSGAHFTPLFPD